MSFLNATVLWLLVPLIAYVIRGKKQNLSQYLRWTVLALLIIAMARPSLWEVKDSQPVEAQSLIFALDLSLSMSAKDIKPSRREASKSSIKAFLKENKNDQIALIGFTVNPLLLSPPTTDHKLVVLALENLKSDYILTKGTNLYKLFKKIAKFSDEGKKVVLFSDGGDEPISDKLLELLEDKNIKVMVVAMATKEGSAIEKKDGTLVQDKAGNIVVSKLNGSLKKLVQNGGVFLPFTSVDSTVKSIAQWLEQQNGGEMINKESRSYFELAFVPLLLAILLFFLSATHFSKKLLAFLLLIGVEVQANEVFTKQTWGGHVERMSVERSSFGFLDGYYLSKAYSAYKNKEYQESFEKVMSMKNRTFVSELILAHIYYKMKKYKEAKAVLEGMRSREPKLKQQLLYELGNCEAKLAYWDKSKAYYVQALQLGEDADALHNLEFVLKQKKKNGFKLSAYNASQAKRTKNSNAKDSKTEKKKKGSSSKSESNSGAGGAGSKSKNAVVKVVKKQENSKSKRVMSSKAYDLINEGYIRETKPW